MEEDAEDWAASCSLRQTGSRLGQKSISVQGVTGVVCVRERDPPGWDFFNKLRTKGSV